MPHHLFPSISPDMNVEQIKSASEAEPFRPFTLHLADGREIPVPHREFLYLFPSGRMVLSWFSLERTAFNIVDRRYW